MNSEIERAIDKVTQDHISSEEIRRAVRRLLQNWLENQGTRSDILATIELMEANKNDA